MPGHDHPDEPTGSASAADEGEPREVDAAARRSGPPSALARNLVIGPLILLVVAGWVSDTFFLAYHDEHPLIFIALNARNRNLVLASPYLDTLSYYVVGTVRLVLSDPLFFLLGVWYGDGAVRWAEQKSPSYGSLLRSAERWFEKAAYPLVAVAPNNFICLFAGAAGMSVPIFLVLNVGGTIARLWVLRWAGDVFSTPLGAVSDFIKDHRIAVLVVSLAIVGFTIWNERRRGGGEISDLAHLDEEVRRGGSPGSRAGAPPDESPRD